MMQKETLIVIAGATACGKTETSIELANLINGEIISADSMQVYKHMDIGTAKPTKNEMRGIRHYLIDEIYPNEEYSVAEFQKRAKTYISEIHKNGKIPIVVGGTGFYINALLYGNKFTETAKDDKLRSELTQYATLYGADKLHKRLSQIDPEAAEQIHENNIKRVIRAIEYFEQSGEKISVHNEREKKRALYYNAFVIILNMERKKLYERINKRVDIMLEKGLISEVKSLLDMGYKESLVSMQGLGYKEIIRYLNGYCTLDEAVEELKKGTRHFAKRQITWFSRQCTSQFNAKWLDVNEFSSLIKMARHIKDDILKT